jgi:small nuclear ribonucleoprotein (snRNP)-like protein
MNSNELYPVIFRNQRYNLTFEFVKELLKISEYCGSDISLIIKTKNRGEIIGTIKEFEGYNPLMPADVYIPIEFKIETDEGIELVNFLEVESIDIYISTIS